jgi:hypothetical protein
LLRVDARTHTRTVSRGWNLAGIAQGVSPLEGAQEGHLSEVLSCGGFAYGPEQEVVDLQGVLLIEGGER